MMHALVIDHDAEAKLVALRKLAEENVVRFADMYRRSLEEAARKEHGGPRPEDPHPGHTVMLRVKYSCTYTVEEHRPALPCRHISVSGPNDLPAPSAVALLMKFMGFQTALMDAKVWTEEVENGRHAGRLSSLLDQ